MKIFARREKILFSITASTGLTDVEKKKKRVSRYPERRVNIFRKSDGAHGLFALKQRGARHRHSFTSRSQSCGSK